MALKLLVDTCVWLDLAKDYRQQPVLSAIEDLIEAGEVELVVPQIVLEEFERNKSRIIEETRRSLQSHLRIVRDAVTRFADDTVKAKTLETLLEVDHTAVIKGDAVNDSVARIEEILKKSSVRKTNSAVKQRVTDRALQKKAPYHRSQNSVADAILVEIYNDMLTEKVKKRHKCAFVTHNTKDFSELNGDRRKPHADLAPLFKSKRSVYAVSIVDVIKTVDPALLDDHDSEFTYTQQPRRLSEILEEEHLLFRRVWYNRHWNLRIDIREGRVFVLPRNKYSTKPYRPDQILDTVWAQALAAAKKTEEELGTDNLGPWDDFEWGMINGKLSALRWVLGDEWDMLDT
jgi:hypothetical protein